MITKDPNNRGYVLDDSEGLSKDPEMKKVEQQMISLIDLMRDYKLNDCKYIFDQEVVKCNSEIGDATPDGEIGIIKGMLKIPPELLSIGDEELYLVEFPCLKPFSKHEEIPVNMVIGKKLKEKE